MPVATVIGHHPAYYIASTWTTSYETDEVDIAGALLQEPANMVRCETIDVMVPADAEIVIEGEVPPNYMEDEGPFCEHAGMTHGTLQQPIINVKCITMRKNPIYYALQGGRPISESQPLDGFPDGVGFYARIKDVGGFIDVKDVVALPYAGGSHIIVVQMTPRKMGEVRSTLMALLSSPYLHPKIGIAVDEDIDPHNAQSIMYALSTRVNPKVGRVYYSRYVMSYRRSHGRAAAGCWQSYGFPSAHRLEDADRCHQRSGADAGAAQLFRTGKADGTGGCEVGGLPELMLSVQVVQTVQAVQIVEQAPASST